MTTTTNKPATRTPPNLERAIRAAAAEMSDDADTLTDFALHLSHDLRRGQQYALLQRLVEIGRRMHKTIGQLCHASDKARDRRTA